MAAQGQHLLASERIADLDGVVVAGRSESLAVGTEDDARDPAGMPAEADQFLAGLQVPDDHVLVFTGRGEQLAVRTERDADHLLVVAVKGKEPLAGLRIPERDVAIRSDAARGQTFAVGAVDNAAAAGRER